MNNKTRNLLKILEKNSFFFVGICVAHNWRKKEFAEEGQQTKWGHSLHVKDTDMPSL